MLERLHIKNIALIEEIEISFGSGLNILSGETGAGKSIIIDSINFILGGRISKDFIRTGETSAYAEALFYISSTDTINALKNSGIDIDENDESSAAVLVYRSINDSGKTICRINGRIITLGMLKEYAPLFINIHGQHEHQSLLNPVRHINLVDRFCGQGIDELKTQLGQQYKNYKDVAKKLSAIASDEKERVTTIDMLSFQINEIKSADLKKNEDIDLLERKAVLNSSERLIKAVSKSLELLYGLNSDDMSALDKLSKALVEVQAIGEIDKSKSTLSEALSGLLSGVEDIVSELRGYYASLEHDPNELDRIEQRLDLIYSLKRKYGSSVNEILEYYSEIVNRFELITNSGEEIEKLSKQKKSIEKELIRICKEMSALRKEGAKKIENDIVSTLHELGMKNAAFEIRFEQRDSFTLNGFDKIEFFISPNHGENLKPLAKTASGGEMSRVMLAIKCVLSDADNIETFIFDEIDTGVSGRTAQMVAEKLSFLSSKRQILSITHLPQIAAMADDHFLIEKKSNEGRVVTNISKIEGELITYELARLTSGAQITDTTLKAAEEMKQLAKQIKFKNIH